MTLNFWVSFFVNRLSMENCVKLYAVLIIAKNKNISRNDAIKIAWRHERKDLKYLLLNLISFGPN